MCITIIIKHLHYLEPPWEVGEKVDINGTGNVTKMIAMLIYSKTLQKSSPSELKVL